MIYLGQPYASPDKKLVETRVVMGQAACVALANEGLAVYAPVAQWHQIATRWELPIHAEFWKRQNLAMVQACHEFYILGIQDWQRSVGLEEEVRLAVKLNKPLTMMNIVQLQHDNERGAFLAPIVSYTTVTDVAQLLRYFQHGKDNKKSGDNSRGYRGITT